MRVKRSDIGSVIDDIRIAKTTDNGYFPLNPAICSDSERLFVGSSLHGWLYMFDLDGAEDWLFDGHRYPAGREIAAAITAAELRDLLGASESFPIEIID